SVFRALRQHPASAGPIGRKGVHYFDVEYQRGPNWYLGHFPLQSSVSRQAHRAGCPVVVGEASPFYMAHPLAGRRIGADLPEVKVVALLRDPIERAYSAHAHELARGHETEDFETAIACEPNRLAGEADRMIAEPGYRSHAMRHHAYLFRGHYVDQLRALEQYIDRERILVLDSHRYFEEPDGEFGRLLEFLGLPATDDVIHDRHNMRPRLPLSGAVHGRLVDHFAPYDAALADWLGWEPSWMIGLRT
ncbi:MAG: sulfotransferase domain-containing protein, partial [Nocardioidaceae bacterium]